MQFFQGIADLNLTGDLHIVIRPNGEKLSVSVMLRNEKCGDPAAKQIAPIAFTDLPATIDEGFFAALSTPLKEHSGLLIGMEAHLKSVEDAKKISAAAKAAATKSATPAKEIAKPAPALSPEQIAQQKFDNLMTDIDKLVADKKYNEAIKKLPTPAEFPNHIPAVSLKRKQLNDLRAYGFITPANVSPKTEDIAPAVKSDIDVVDSEVDQAQDDDYSTEDQDDEDSNVDDTNDD
ncbi:hypothetical protein [Spirosoma sp.]|uniref:hypothetical protein n=1 Tax=Spirosoma sp. TaxID=1899569 RepID=UPI00261A1A2E|nr:hypothetical protein [Spirosoma sp.]MCX6217658.1 hypothetical protein [Spirosoma sp.]